MDSHSLALMLPVNSAHVFSAGLELSWEAPLVRIAAAGLCLLVGVGTVYALRRRQAVAATRLTAGGFWRLAAAGLRALAISLAAVGIVFAHAHAYALVHPSRSTADRTPATAGLTGYQSVSFASADGLTLRGWYVPPRNGAVIIFVHGFAGNRSALLDEAGLLAGHGYGALLFDLRNSGESEGALTTLGLREVNDVQGAVDFVLAQPGVDAGRIGLMGISMGGATAILSAARIPQISAVTAESTYTRLHDSLGVTFKQMTGLPSFPFAPLVIFFGEREAGVKMSEVNPVAEIASISPRPILLVHGRLDEVIPVANAYALYAAAKEPKELYVMAQAGHGGFLQAEPEAYTRCLLGFLDRHLLPP